MIKIKLLIGYYWQDIIGVSKLLLMLVAGLMIYQVPYFLRNSQLVRYDSEIMGQIESIDKIIGIDQTEEGGKVVIKGYDIKYKYEVDRNEFIKTETVSKIGLRRGQRIRLFKLTEGDSLRIKYKSEHPDKSMIDMSEYH